MQDALVENLENRGLSANENLALHKQEDPLLIKEGTSESVFWKKHLKNFSSYLMQWTEIGPVVDFYDEINVKQI